MKLTRQRHSKFVINGNEAGASTSFQLCWRRLTRVGSFVDDQVTGGGEAFTAIWTYVVFDTCVGLHVHRERTRST
jgi:hypothetical protein